MADPYSGVPITGYDSNPPADDGSAVESNRVKWATIKDKLGDPVKERTDDMNTALIAAFARMIGGAGITSTSINYTVQSTDQGKFVRATSSGITITTPDATDVGDPFVFALLNDTTGDITFDGSGSQTIDGDANVTVPAGAGLIVGTDGSNWFTTGQNFQRTLTKPQAYLTLLSVATQALSPMPTSDQSAKTAVYCRPDGGNLMPIPDGTTYAVREFSELTLTLSSNHVASGIYDVFAFADPSNNAITIGTGTVWNTVAAGSGARGTGAGTTELDLLKGLPVNKVAMTMRNGATTYSIGAKCAIWLGSIFMDGTNGQITCHVSAGASRKWGIYNAWNQREIILEASISTASWSGTGASTWRASNNDTTSSLTVFVGAPGVVVNTTFTQTMTVPSTVSGTTGQIGIGWNVTNSPSGGTIGNARMGDANALSNFTTLNGTPTAHMKQAATIGIHTVTSIEFNNSSSVTYYGSTGSLMVLRSMWWG